MTATDQSARVPADAAAEWIARWDAQQEGYIPFREERFAVHADAVAAALDDVEAPVVVDLGCGPGSLTARLADRLPNASFIGVDADPLLLGLATAHYGDTARWVRADLADPSWAGALPPVVHAAVSTTALHWMGRDDLAALYRSLAGRTAPGGVFANADHMPLPDERMNALADAVGRGRTGRAETGEREEWGPWWDAALADERLAPLRAEKRPTPQTTEDAPTGTPEHHHGSNLLSAADHLDLLREAGYASAGVLWQAGDDHLVAAVR
ncbi:class I SAM-dependent methyltransferase [Nocardiopsis suaedae]|uniref:Class I SAM-dependent methyltransferase n=1 Tax=Nocardiopsis suaedae TaxID=3018444 RepID=A0ABT4TI23_9ACTN|nr:class I SAM-dependent methyltransferase [Nocardiopsis suaedae]MDA2804021.1 class I SAM-dependent methyltransferase [Nocardiopsis suaedae]